MSGPLRACDYYAIEISRLEGSPRYEMYWPEKRRDAVRKDMARFLDQWGDCFRDRSRSFRIDYDHVSTVRFRLPRLTQPAMPEDVAAGRAIFSLRDRPDAQVRIVSIKPLPSIARWKTLKQFPLRDLAHGVAQGQRSSDPKVWERLPEELFDREGLIWQAEEVLLDGKMAPLLRFCRQPCHCQSAGRRDRTFSIVSALRIPIVCDWTTHIVETVKTAARGGPIQGANPIPAASPIGTVFVTTMSA